MTTTAHSTTTRPAVPLTHGITAQPWYDDAGEFGAYEVEWQGCESSAMPAGDELQLLITVDSNALILTEEQYQRLRAFIIADIPGQLAAVFKANW